MKSWAVRFFLLIEIFTLTMMTPSARAGVTLVTDGKPAATIVLPDKATRNEKLAAEELQTHIALISGATLPIAKAADGAAIVIGSAVAEPDLDAIRAKSDDEAAFALRAGNNRIDLVGLSDDGTLYAAYELLEQLGVRWFMPGDLGVDVIETKTITVDDQTLIDHPGFKGRHLQAVQEGTWRTRMRLSGLNAGGHGLGPKFDREKNPEYFIHENGEPTHQEDVSHPEVLKGVVEFWRQRLEAKPQAYRYGYIPVGPHDGAGFGDHEWDGEYLDPFTGRTSMTDRYIRFFNMVLEELNKDYPDLGIGFYAYTRDIFPPEKTTPHPKILPILAPINFDRFHSIMNPLSWEKQYIRQLVDGWQKTGLDLMYRGYLFNLADHGLPFTMIDLVRTDFPYYHKQGVVACRVECIPNWTYQGPALYLASKIFWKPDLDSDALLDEYFTRYFGPAAKPMREHWDIIEQAYIHGDYFTGNVFDVPHILTAEVRSDMRRTLEEAERAAGNDNRYAKRVALVRMGFDYGDANIEMINAYRRGQWVEANEHHERIINDLMPPMLEHDPPLLHPTLPRYLKRFWSTTVQAAAERVTGGNEQIVLLPDVWHYMQDPYNGGEQMGLWKQSLGTGPWQPIKTATESTSNQGLRYYKGTLWYRTTFELTDAQAGRTMKLFLAGVDDTPRAWINDHKLELELKGAAPIGRPWEFAAGDSVRAGKNTIVIAVEDTRINELGTVGLTAPVMLWSPGESQ